MSGLAAPVARGGERYWLGIAALLSVVLAALALATLFVVSGGGAT